jgi:hypothetical protein
MGEPVTKPLPLASAVLAEADRLINNDRQEAYDHPAEDFAATALVWTGLLHAAGWRGQEPVLPTRLVPILMVGLKIRREAHRHKEDNLTDACGYAACVAELEHVAAARF